MTLAGLLLLAVPSAYLDTHQQDWRSAAPWMASRTVAGARMIAGNALRSITYYLERVGGAFVPPVTTDVDALANPSAGRVWLVMSPALINSPLREKMSTAFEVVEDRAFGRNLRIVLLDQVEQPAPTS